MGDIIVIGKAKESFGPDFKIKTLVEAFKFILFMDSDNKLKMLIMEPEIYHAEGAHSYVMENKLEDIMIHGGGTFMFCAPSNVIHYANTSTSFGGVCPDELKSFHKEQWGNEIKAKLSFERGVPRKARYSVFALKKELDDLINGKKGLKTVLKNSSY